jgi:F-type H+-transporting ATPase subunit delta
MIISRVARRYADAIYDGIPTEIGAEAFFADLTALSELLAASRELKLFFHSPIIPQDAKARTVEALCEHRFSAYLRQVLLFLVEKGREKQLEEFIEALRDLHRRRNGIRVATVTSATDLSSVQRSALEAALAAAGGCSVETRYATDPALIGGLVARLGDTVYDGSISRQLARLRQRFAAGM